MCEMSVIYLYMCPVVLHWDRRRRGRKEGGRGHLSQRHVLIFLVLICFLKKRPSPSAAVELCVAADPKKANCEVYC